MNHKEQFRNRARATSEHTPYVHESYATKPHDSGNDNGVSRCGRLRVPSHPVQHCNPKHGTAEDSEEGDQRGGASGGTASAEVEAFLTYLAVAKRVSASTQNQAKSAILFLYKEVLGDALPWLEGIESAKRPARLPVVLTRQEVEPIPAHLSSTAARWD